MCLAASIRSISTQVALLGLIALVLGAAGCGDVISTEPVPAKQSAASVVVDPIQIQGEARVTTFVVPAQCPEAESALAFEKNDWKALTQLREKRDFARLESVLEELLAAYRANPLCETFLRRAHYRIGSDSANALDDLEAWAQESPNVTSHVLYAESLVDAAHDARGGEWAEDTPSERIEKMNALLTESFAHISAAAALDPRHPIPTSVFAKAAKLKGACKQVLAAVEAYSEVDPLSFSVRRRAMGACEPRWGGSYKAMKEIAEDAQPYVDQNPRLRVLMGFADAEKGYTAWRKDEWDDAIKHYMKALSYGDFELAWSEKLARNYRESGAVIEALREGKNAVATIPTFKAGHVAVGRALMAMKRYQDAYAAFDEAVQLEPASAEALKLRGWAAEFSFQFEEALQDYAQSLRLNSHNQWVVKRYLAVAFEKTQNFEAGEALFAELSAKRPENWKLLGGLGYAQLRLGRAESKETFGRFFAKAKASPGNKTESAFFQNLLEKEAKKQQSASKSAPSQNALPGLSLISPEKS